MNTQEKIEVMQMYADNAGNADLIMQVRKRGSNDTWLDCIVEPQWNWQISEYRIKPKEPNKFWVIVNPCTKNYIYDYEEEQIARSALNNLNQYQNSQSYMILVEEILS